MHLSLVCTTVLFLGYVSAKECSNITVPVSIQSRNAVFDGIATPQGPLVTSPQLGFVCPRTYMLTLTP